jgi:hypothetical protein
MRFIKRTIILLATIAPCISPLYAQEQSASQSESQPATVPDTAGIPSSRSGIPNSAASIPGSTGDSKSLNNRPPDTGVFTIPSQKTSITFIPKFKQRINDLGDQIRLVQSKGFITGIEASKFLDQQSKLLLQESEVSMKGFPKADLDTLEKAITLLNADLFAAMRKCDPVKPGSAEKEVNDPNLIPAYTDPELQPNSGHMSEPKK